MVALVDRGFNVQDLFLAYHVTVAIPPFTKGKTHFTKVQVEQAKTISRARIHVERAIFRELYLDYRWSNYKPSATSCY